jgi:hypothetical protein
MGEGSQRRRGHSVRAARQSKTRGVCCASGIALALWLFTTAAQAQPVVIENPQGAVVTAGQRVMLHFDAVADTRLRYRWVFNDRYISSRGRTLRFRAVPRRAGVYRAVAIDREGNYAFSAPAVVEVLPRSTSPAPSPQQPPQPSPLPPRPVILVQPQDVTVREHDTAVFRVTLNDSGPYTTIVWHNDNPLEGSHQIPDGLGFNVHSTTLAIPNSLNADNYNGLYWIAVTNRAGGTVSRKARLTVVPE